MAQTINPYLLYADAAGALDFLSRAFGFEETMRMPRPDGSVGHAEMKLGDGRIMLGQPEREYRNPQQLGAATVLLYVYVDDVDAHCERARAAGAEIANEPADQPYGERTYDAHDPEGHSWYFAEQING